VTPSKDDDRSGISESLRTAIESTFAATAGSAGETRERAAELLDEVTKRGRGARDEVVRKGSEARDEVVRKGSEASADVVHKVEEELRSISERLAKLEASLRHRP
jgi:polyhydroxyalkanoate synthesis regulator phasin